MESDSVSLGVLMVPPEGDQLATAFPWLMGSKAAGSSALEGMGQAYHQIPKQTAPRAMCSAGQLPGALCHLSYPKSLSARPGFLTPLATPLRGGQQSGVPCTLLSGGKTPPLRTRP